VCIPLNGLNISLSNTHELREGREVQNQNASNMNEKDLFFLSLLLKLEGCSVGSRAKVKQQLTAGIARCQRHRYTGDIAQVFLSYSC